MNNKEFLKEAVLDNTRGDDENKILYHYTSADGFVGIMESGLLFSSHISVFNDPTELKYGINIINQKIRENIAIEPDEKVKSQIEDFLPNLEHIELFFPNNEMIFGLSFSEDGDLLSQWREYGRNGKGYSIGIKKKTIKRCHGLNIEIFDKGIYNELFFVKMIYDEDIQNDIGNKFYNFLKDTTCQGNNFRKEYYSLIVLLAMVMKHDSYKEEKEWRLIFRGNSVSANENIIFYRVTNDKIIPYIKFGYLENNEDIKVLDYNEISYT